MKITIDFDKEILIFHEKSSDGEAKAIIEYFTKKGYTIEENLLLKTREYLYDSIDGDTRYSLTTNSLGTSITSSNNIITLQENNTIG